MPRDLNRATTWIKVDVIHKTDAAVLVSNGKTRAWVPLAAIIDSEDDIVIGKTNSIEITESLATDKDLV